MNNAPTPLDCNEVAERLLELHYGELDDQQQQDVETHLASCSVCRNEFDALQDTLCTLDQWPPVEDACDAAALATLAEAQYQAVAIRPQSWIIRLRPFLTGLAAGLVLFAALAYFEADMSFDDGRLTLSLRRPGSPAAAPDGMTAPDTIPPEWQHLVRSEVEDGTIVTMDAMGDVLHRWERRQEARHVALLETLDRVRAQDMSLFDNALRTAVRSASEESFRTRQAVDGIARFVANTETTKRREY